MLLALAVPVACIERPPAPPPRLPSSLSAWQDDIPYGEKGIQTEARARRETEDRLHSVDPAIKWNGSDVVTIANQPAARAWIEGYFRGLGWEKTGAANAPNTVAWKSDDRFFAVQFIKIYRDGDLVLVSYYAKGFARR